MALHLGSRSLDLLIMNELRILRGWKKSFFDDSKSLTAKDGLTAVSDKGEKFDFQIPVLDQTSSPVICKDSPVMLGKDIGANAVELTFLSNKGLVVTGLTSAMMGQMNVLSQCQWKKADEGGCTVSLIVNPAMMDKRLNEIVFGFTTEGGKAVKGRAHLLSTR